MHLEMIDILIRDQEAAGWDTLLSRFQSLGYVEQISILRDLFADRHDDLMWDYIDATFDSRDRTRVWEDVQKLEE
jgi:hypothetical protein